MKMFSSLFPAALAALTLTACAPTDPPDVVTDLDVERYMGTWYDVGSFPQSFQDGCTCTTATYALQDNGEVSVTNRCRRDAVDGESTVAEARAWVPDSAEPGKLKVEFFPLFAADYWVVDLWEDDPAEPYSLAVVSDPSREFLWILSRTPQVDAQVLDGLVTDLEQRGWDMSRLQDTEHEGCVYDGVE